MPHTAILRFAGTTFALAALLAGCGGGGSGSADSGSGTLRVSMTDAPACGFDSVFVTVSKVRVHASSAAAPGDAGWSEIALSPPRRIDLLSLANGVLFELGSTPLPAGSYQQIRLVLAENSAMPMANAVAPSGGAAVELDTPSGMSSGIKLQAHFDVPAGQTADVVLDFDACRSIVKRGASGRYNLKPVVSVIPMISVGAISGHVQTDLLSRGVTVTAQSGGVVVKAAAPGATGGFNLSPIPAGTYDVVITAAGSTTRVVTGVPVVTGGSAVLSTLLLPLSLPDSPVGAVGGVVAPAAAEATVRATQTLGTTGPKIEVASVRADGLTGEYAMSLPRANVQAASWGTGTLPLVFVDVAGTGGKYVIEASAGGYLPSPAVSPLLTVGAAPIVQDFVLTAAP